MSIRPGARSIRSIDMSRGLVERASSDLGHSAYSSTATTTGDDLHRQCTNNNKQRLALLLSGAWRRSEATTVVGAESSGKKKHAQGSSKRGGGGLDNIGPLLKKYMAMAEQLFASFSSGGSSGGRDDDRRRRSPINSFSSSKRHRGIRLFSAPASLRGSPASSGRLSARGIIPKASSGESTAEDLQSAIQAAIAHCKNSSIAAAKQQQADGGDLPTSVN